LIVAPAVLVGGMMGRDLNS